MWADTSHLLYGRSSFKIKVILIITSCCYFLLLFWSCSDVGISINSISQHVHTHHMFCCIKSYRLIIVYVVLVLKKCINMYSMTYLQCVRPRTMHTLMLNPMKKIYSLKPRDGKYLSTVTQCVKGKITFQHRLVILKLISFSRGNYILYFRGNLF